MATPLALTRSSFDEAFPNSTKIYADSLDGGRVPFRQIALGDSPDGTHNHAVHVYDTSGPQGHDVLDGLPALRASWIRARDVGESLIPSIARDLKHSLGGETGGPALRAGRGSPFTNYWKRTEYMVRVGPAITGEPDGAVRNKESTECKSIAH